MKASHEVIKYYVDQLRHSIDKYRFEKNNTLVQIKQNEDYLDEIVSKLEASQEALTQLTALLKEE